MKANSSKALLVAVLTLSAASAAKASEPRPKEAPDPENVTVTGRRIRSFGQDDIAAAIESGDFRKIRAGAGSPLSVAERNANGKRQAQKAKAEKDKGESNYWLPSQWVSEILKNITMQINATVQIRYWDHEGNLRGELKGCLEKSINTDNKETCSSIEQGKTPEGKNVISIHKLEAFKSFNKYILGYSTSSTITYIFDTPDELINFFKEVDPNFTL